LYNDCEFKSAVLKKPAPTSQRWSLLLLFLGVFIFFFSGVGTSMAAYTAVTALGGGASTEAEIRAGGETLTITLTGASWSSDFASGVAATKQAKVDILLDNMTGATESSEWAEVIAVLRAAPGSFVRTDAQNLTITFPLVAGYSIAADQVITVNLQPGLLASLDTLTTAPAFTITAGTAATLSGTIASGRTETDIVNGGRTLIISLTNATWVAGVITNETLRVPLLDSLTAATEAAEWTEVINTIKNLPDPASKMERSADGKQISITLPPVVDYNITLPQTITFAIPGGSQAALIGTTISAGEADPVFTINNSPQSPDTTGSVSLSGTVIGAAEADVIAGGETVIITLNNNTWATDVASAVKLSLLLDNLTAGTENSEWAKIIAATKTAATVVRTSNTVVTITLQAVAGYEITDDQIITVTVPASLLTDSSIPLTGSPQFTIKANTAATISGTAVGCTESDILAGGKTIIVSLVNDTWVADVITATQKRDTLLAAFDAAGADATQWDTKVINALKTLANPTSNMVLSSDRKQITITMPPVAGYNIASATSPQVVTLTVPAALLTSGLAPVETAPNISVVSVTPSATVSGTICTASSEADIGNGSKTIIITLSNDVWASDVVTDPVKCAAVIAGFTAPAGADQAQWNTNVRGALNSANLVRTSDTVLTINLPVVSSYNISAAQDISLSIPVNVLSLADAAIAASPTPCFTISPASVTAVLSGTAGTATEGDILAGSKTIIVTLTNDVWASDVITDAAKRAALIAGLAAGTDLPEWAKVTALLNSTNMVRTSDTVLTITLPATATYNISSNQTIGLTIPISTLTYASAPVAASSSLQIKAVTATISGTVISSPPIKNDIIAGSKTIIVTLANDTWASDVVTDAAKRAALIAGLAVGTEPLEWAKVTALLNSTNIVRTSSTVLTITLPATSGYNITATQTVTLTIPAAALSSGIACPATPGFDITTDRNATLAGTVVTAPASELDIVNGAKTITITLSNNTWKDDVVSNTTKLNTLLAGLKATGTESAAWAKVTTALKASPSSVVRTSNTVVTITLPVITGYNIVNSQTINLTIPKALLTIDTSDVTASPGFSISALTPTVAASGTLTASSTGSDVVAGGKTLILTLTNDIWATDVASNKTKREALLGGITASGTEAAQWTKVITALKANSAPVLRNSDTVVTITLPAVTGYSITSAQVVSVTVPKTVLTVASTNVTLTPAFTISLPASVSLSGTVVSDGLTEAEVISGGKTLVLTLLNDTWNANIVSDAAKRNALIDGLSTTSSGSELAKIITALKADPSKLVRTSNTVLTITFPAVAGYSINSSQTVNLTIPSGSLALSNLPVSVTPLFTVKMPLATVLASDAKLDQLLENATNNIKVNVAKKYIKSVAINHGLFASRAITNLTIVTELEVNSVNVSVTNSDSSITTHTGTTYTATTTQRQFSIGFSDLTVPCDCTITVRDSSGAPLQKALVVRAQNGATTAYTAPVKSVAGVYSLGSLMSDTTTFGSILSSYGLDELMLSI